MTASIPGKDGHVSKPKRFNSFLPSTGMFMAAVEQEERFANSRQSVWH